MELLRVALTESDPTIRRPAEEQLHTLFEREPWNVVKQLVDQLQISVTGGDEHGQFLCVTALKTYVERHWRHSGLSPEQKQLVRERLIDMIYNDSFVSSAAMRLTTLLIIVVARVCRFDFPKAWPNAFEIFAQRLTSSPTPTNPNRLCTNALMLHRALLDQHSRGAERQLFVQVCGLVRPTSLELFTHATEMFTQDPSKPNAYLMSLSIKILRRTVAFGMEEYTPEVLQPIVVTFCAMLEKTGTHHDDLERIVYHLAKLLRTCVFHRPNSLGPFLEHINPFLVRVVTDVPEPQKWFYRRALVEVMTFLTKCFEMASCLHHYQHALAKLDVHKVCGVLIRRYLCLNPDDLEMWGEDPEEFVASQDLDVEDDDDDDDGDGHAVSQYEKNVRGCAQDFLLAIVDAHNESAASIPNYVRDALSANDLPAQESALCALGFCWYYVSAHVDIASLLPNLLHCATMHPEKVVRRRALWVVGMWSEIVKSKEDRRQILKAVLERFCDAREDTVLRLTAMLCIGQFIADPQFEADDLSDGVRDFLVTFFDVIGNIRHYELSVHSTEMLTNVLRVLAPCFHGSNIVPHLLSFLQTRWTNDAKRAEVDTHPHLRATVLSALRCAMHLGAISPDERAQLESCACDLIVVCMDVDRTEHVWLQDDAALLWNDMLDTAAEVSECVFGLVPVVLARVLQRSFSEFDAVLHVLMMYTVLSPEPLGSCCVLPELMTSLGKVILDTRGTVLRHAVSTMDVMLTTFPDAVDHLQGFFSQLVTQIMECSEDDRELYCEIVPTMIPLLFRAVVLERHTFFKRDAAPILEKYLELSDFISGAFDKTICCVGAMVLYRVSDLNDDQLLESIKLVCQGEAERDLHHLGLSYIAERAGGDHTSPFRSKLTNFAQTKDIAFALVGRVLNF